MALHFCPLFSGSSGNTVYVGNGQSHLLIDAGKSGRTIENALRSIQVDPSKLSAIVVTHEHYDHISGAGVLSRKYNLPIYATEGTWEGIKRRDPAINPRNQIIIERHGDVYGDFFIGRLNIQPFKTSHDAEEPVGYVLSSDGLSAGVATDLGAFTSKQLETLSGVKLLLLESNHDEAMVSASRRYTAALKKRILSRSGHLSNTQCGEAIVKLFGRGVGHFILAHLSEENNNPELALETVTRVLLKSNICVGSDVAVDLAPRDGRGEYYTVGLEEAVGNAL